MLLGVMKYRRFKPFDLLATEDFKLVCCNEI